MDMERIAEKMADNVRRVCALVQGASERQARWKPGPESWSILEVVNHLLDEEREDFRVRVEYTLHRPGETWPAIDPGGRVMERKYNEQDLALSLDAFLDERDKSLAWLRALSSPDWEMAYAAPWGAIRAGDILAAWVAHDLLHMRQLVELHWAYTREALQPYSVEYAGQW